MVSIQADVQDGSETKGTQSLARGLAVLTALSEERRELSVRELALELGLSRPTAYRLAKTLEQHGFLKFDPAARTYSIGSVAFAVGSLFLPASFSSAIGEIMRDLRAATTHTVHVAVVDGLSLLNIGAEESLNMARVVSHVGQRTPLHATAAGKAYLATLPTSKVEEIIVEAGLPRLASRTITDLNSLLAEMETTRRRGYGIAIDELAEGLHGFGIAVRGDDSRRVHTVAVSLPTGSLRSSDEEESLVKHLRDAASRVEAVVARYPR
jgi:DNA-binding IclR family transcriptional regulator